MSGRRRGHAEEHENHERWLVTYADMLTLLMVLFVVLYAISQVDDTKFHQLSSSLASAFNGGQKSVFEGSPGLMDNASTSVDPQLAQNEVDTGISKELPADPAAAKSQQATDQQQKQPQQKPTTSPADKAKFDQLAKQITDALAKANLAGAATTSIDQRGLVVSVVTSSVIFGGNSADLLPGGQQVLDVIAPTLVPLANGIEVDGNTNQQQVSTYPYPSGWELSAARASSVVRYLAGRGVAESRLTAVGQSDQRPLYPPADPRSITMNRRVDIVVLATGSN